MKKIPYYKQNHKKACGLACLKMALEYFLDKKIKEKQLLKEVKKDYGEKFNIIWNPTIVLLAAKNGLKVESYALWPLHKKKVWKKAHQEWKKDPKNFKWQVYEPRKGDPSFKYETRVELAYKHIFEAVKQGAKVKYGSLTLKRIEGLLRANKLIILTINIKNLFSKKEKEDYHHSILLVGIRGQNIIFHDPIHGHNLEVSKGKLKKAQIPLGAGIVLSKHT